MAFKPANSSRPSQYSGDFEQRNYPTPKAGARRARVSLIVDMGIQEREPFEETDGTLREQKPCQQVAVFVDLVNDVVDYGGSIGEQQYRLLVNKEFAGKIQGINFQGVPQKNADGEILKDKNGKHLPYVLHPASPLSKIAKATDRADVISSMDIEQLLGLPFIATVEVRVSEDKNGKLDKDGNVVVYKNTYFRGASLLPTDDDDQPIKVAELRQPAKVIQFSTATKEDVTFIRANLRKQIKLAQNYVGSKMQKAIEAWEAENEQSESPAQTAEAPAAKKPAANRSAPPKPPTGFDDMDDDIPF